MWYLCGRRQKATIERIRDFPKNNPEDVKERKTKQSTECNADSMVDYRIRQRSGLDKIVRMQILNYIGVVRKS